MTTITAESLWNALCLDLRLSPLGRLIAPSYERPVCRQPTWVCFAEFCRALQLDEDANALVDQRVLRRPTRVHLVDRKEQPYERVKEFYAAMRPSKRPRFTVLIADSDTDRPLALRAFSRKLLARSAYFNLVPIYVDLREWSPAQPWSLCNPPTEQQLREFLVHFVKDRMPARLHGFVDEWLLMLLDRGGLFLLFDHFHALPGLAESHVRPSLVQEVSRIVRFTATHPKGRVVLASGRVHPPRFSAWQDALPRPGRERAVAELLPVQ
jgi:hypothetical protein